MRGSAALAVVAIAIIASSAACGASAPGPTPTPSPSPSVATEFGEYATAFCSAWGTLFRVVGNPETAGWTDGVHRLQAAAEARDAATAASLQASINGELEAARKQIAYAGGWPPAARPMAEMDRFFAAEEAWITAYVNVAKDGSSAPDPQAAFEAAGGVDAWRAMFETYADVAPHRPASVSQCAGAPISP